MQKMNPLSAWCLVLLVLIHGANCSISARKLQEFHQKLQVFTTHGPFPSRQASVPKRAGKVFYPIGYGADPNCVQESSEAILKTLHDAFKVQNELELLRDVHDLGGVVIDLQGGNYKISRPIRLPCGRGNVVVQKGTLRASDTFPSDRHLVELRSPKSTIPGRRIYYEDITFRDILFDSSQRGGGILIVDSVRIRVDNCFFLHFNTQGILVLKGHEIFISSCFLGQHPTIGGDKRERTFSGTAIDLESNDNVISEVAIFSAEVGVLVRGEANLITGVHCYNKANVFGGVGILVKPGGTLTRINNCYLDYTNIVIEDPLNVHVTDGLFLGNANVLLRSIKGKISGLNIVDNMFKGDEFNMNPIVEVDGNFTSIDQVMIDRNNVRGMSMKSTVGRLTVARNGTKWVADFSSLLIFPNKINHYQYSFYVQDVPVELVGHAVTMIANNVVVVETNIVVNAMVSVEVDQHNFIGENYFFT